MDYGAKTEIDRSAAQRQLSSIGVATEWISYNDLAWTEDWLVDPSDCEEEAGIARDLRRVGNASVALRPVGETVFCSW